jgi:hypothetical protein
MYKYLIVFFLGAPLLGIVFMEGGEYGWSIGLEGHPNGASVAYVGYALIFVLFAFLGGMRWKSQAVFPDTQTGKLEVQYGPYIAGVLLVECVLLVILLFVFDGFRVWTGEIEKGVFRSNLGTFGSFVFMSTKFLIPGLLAYGACLYLQVDRKGTNRLFWWAACGVAFVCGSTWGFKSTSMFMLFPSFLIIFWHITPRQVVLMGLAVVVSLVGFSFWFDAGSISDANVFESLWFRSTVLQGDVSWFVWEQFVRGETFPTYGWTLLTFVGDNIFTAVTGIDRSQTILWSEYHYDYMLNFLAGRPLYESSEGGSIIGTIFSEGLIAGGIPGLIFFAALGGLLVGWIFRELSRGIAEGRIVRVALLSTYFCWVVLPWINGGGIVQLFHVAIIAGMAAIYVAIMLLNGSVTRSARRAMRSSNSWLRLRN